MGAMPSLNIGQVAELAGVTAPTVRYYEQIGLLRKAMRSASGYRRYSEATVRELDFIRKARALGFSLDEIGEIVQLTRAGRKPCARVIDLARKHLSEVDEQMRKLAAFREQLHAELARWERTAPEACEGMCGMIASSSPAAAAAEPAPFRPRQRGR